MSVRKRIISINLYNKTRKNQKLANKLGVEVRFNIKGKSTKNNSDSEKIES